MDPVLQAEAAEMLGLDWEHVRRLDQCDALDEVTDAWDTACPSVRANVRALLIEAY